MRRWDKFKKRALIIKATRNFFYQKKFLEVETPLLLPALIPESYLDIFETNLRDRKGKFHKMFLAPSPEVSIKKLLVEGCGNCFEITKSFRNSETGSNLHNPEFTMIEWYRVGVDYRKIMEDCENLLLYILRKIYGFNSNSFIYQGKEINLTSPWEKISVKDAFEKYTNISFEKIMQYDPKKKVWLYPPEKIARIAKEKGYSITSDNSWEELFNQIFLNEIEPNLGTKGKPTIIYDYPAPLAALSKIKKEDSRFAERFEFYIGGLELGDCYTELTDSMEQKKRFEEEMRVIKNKKTSQIIPDNDFLRILDKGLPDCSGIAVGIDRLVMLFTNSKSINDVLLFPLGDLVNFGV